MKAKEATLTSEQKYAMEVARVGFMAACPFFAHYFYSEMKECPTKDIPTLATDGRTIYYSPEYLAGLKPPERVFALAHEVYHAVSRHPSRMKHYSREGALRGLPYDNAQLNEAQDYVINADLIETGVGMCNPSWLYDPGIVGADLAEDVYEKRYKKQPEGRAKKFGQSGKGARGAKGDPQADQNNGRFDQTLEPTADEATGREDLPDEAEFKEAIARAAAAAKAMGNMPGKFQRLVDEILQPQVNWREHIRMLLTGKLGAHRETWNRPNRRRLVLNPIVIMPGRAGHGAGTVVCAVDTSGSISEKELSAFFAEMAGILADVRPKRVMVIFCDAQVHRVDEAATMDELQHIRSKGAPGGGGTSFVPPFEYLREHNITPDALVYLTDLYGVFPERPSFPVVWCATTDVAVPFGDVVRVKVER